MKIDSDSMLGGARRRLRRRALPSSLMGLVAFSFTLLAFSTVAYTASLPAFVMARSRVGEQGLFNVVARALVGSEDIAVDEEGEPAPEPSPDDSGKDGGRAQDKAFTLGGVSLQGVIGQVAGGQPEKPGDGQEGPGTQEPGGDGSGGGAVDPDPAPDGDGGAEQEQSPSEEEELRAREFLLGHARAVDGYVAKANDCVSAFNSDCLADLATRKAHKSTCYALQMDIFYNRYDVLVNKAPIKNNSKYRKAHGDLISMYRCLLAYMGTLDEAWEINVGFEDPSAHVDEFMGPINSATVNGENIHLAEFKRYYEGFEL